MIESSDKSVVLTILRQQSSVDELPENILKLTLTKIIEDSFGFFLKNQNGHFLGDIKPYGCADRAGIKTKDQIIEVNGANVIKETRKKVFVYIFFVQCYFLLCYNFFKFLNLIFFSKSLQIF